MTDNLTTIPLERCPFCRSVNISSGEVVGSRNRDDSAFYQTACLNCGACSGECDTVELADIAWNTRAEPAIPLEDLRRVREALYTAKNHLAYQYETSKQRLKTLNNLHDRIPGCFGLNLLITCIKDSEDALAVIDAIIAKGEK